MIGRSTHATQSSETRSVIPVNDRWAHMVPLRNDAAATALPHTLLAGITLQLLGILGHRLTPTGRASFSSGTITSFKSSSSMAMNLSLTMPFASMT